MPGLSHEQGAPSRNARCTAIARIVAPPAMGPAPQRHASPQHVTAPGSQAAPRSRSIAALHG
ncbi:hypothetical protein RAA17_01795 [Komagataeibacter rhaeticus]|nr:hypothetical protein [Komagataeibacter rhaeticus]